MKSKKEKLTKLDLAKLAQTIAYREVGLYRLTPKDVSDIEVALRLRIEACEENDELKEATEWKKTWRKFL